MRHGGRFLIAEEEFNPNDREEWELGNKFDQFMKMDTDTLANTFDRLRSNGGLQNQAINKMFDMCSRQMGNTSNLINEMKKHVKYMQNRNS